MTIAAHRSAAMVPENQEYPVGRRISGNAILNELRQRIRISHIPACGRIQPLQLMVRGHFIQFVVPTGDDIVLPLLCAAGFNQNMYLIGLLCLQHLIEIRGRHPVLRLEIGSDHIDENCRLIGAIIAQSSIFRSCLRRHREIRRAHIRVGMLGCRRLVAIGAGRGI